MGSICEKEDQVGQAKVSFGTTLNLNAMNKLSRVFWEWRIFKYSRLALWKYNVLGLSPIQNLRPLLPLSSLEDARYQSIKISLLPSLSTSTAIITPLFSSPQDTAAAATSNKQKGRQKNPLLSPFFSSPLPPFLPCIIITQQWEGRGRGGGGNGRGEGRRERNKTHPFIPAASSQHSTLS